jgi:hypothetical protein
MMVNKHTTVKELLGAVFLFGLTEGYITSCPQQQQQLMASGSHR